MNEKKTSRTPVDMGSLPNNSTKNTVLLDPLTIPIHCFTVVC